jgi:hypothetical protein
MQWVFQRWRLQSFLIREDLQPIALHRALAAEAVGAVATVIACGLDMGSSPSEPGGRTEGDSRIKRSLGFQLQKLQCWPVDGFQL